MSPYLILLLFALSARGQSPLQLDPEEKILRHSPPRVPSTEFEVSPLYKLNDTWIPSHYDVQLTVILDHEDEVEGTNMTAPGTVGIHFSVTQNTEELVLNVNLPTVHSMQIVDKGDETKLIVNVSAEYEAIAHFMRYRLNDTLETGKEYLATLTFTAPISTDRLNGLYLSYYNDSTGTRFLAGTQGEPVHVRQIFPCFDEPNLKATFNVTINHRKEYTAVCNGESISSETSANWPNWNTTKFRETVPMSTYLFALVVAPFSYQEAAPGLSTTKVGVYGEPALIDAGGAVYTADLTAKVLTFIDSHFETQFPMPKLDSGALPQKGGAMENWGLILYRWDLLYWTKGETTESKKNAIASVIAHEVSHQIFGNLVTCGWWSDLWLNEGFATYVSYLAIDAVAPEFKHGEWQLNDAFQAALNFDYGPNSHPLRNSAVTPVDADSYWTSITYDKGSSVIRMVEGFLGGETWLKGVKKYIKTKEYQGAVQDELFAGWQEAVNEDNITLPTTVKQILDTWTLQKGHPLIRVSVRNTDSVFISQERYDAHAEEGLWWLPVTIYTQDNPQLENHLPQLWLSPQTRIVNTAHNTSKWIMVNQDATGFYRVLYDDQLTTNIKSQLDSDCTLLTPLSRSQLLHDYFNLAFQGFVPIETALSLTTYLDQETHFTVWEVVLSQLAKQYQFLEAQPQWHAFKHYLLPKITSALLEIGIEQDEEKHVGAVGILRTKLMDWACNMWTPECLSYAQALQAQWAEDLTQKSPIPIDIFPPIVCILVARGDSAAWEFIYLRYREMDVQNPRRVMLLNALACSSDSSMINEMLLATFTNDFPLEDKLPLLQRLAMNDRGRLLLLPFLDTRFDDVVGVIGEGNMATLLQTLASFTSSQSGLSYFTQLVTNHNVGSPLLNTVRDNVKWVQQWGNPITKWMEANIPEQGEESTTAEGISSERTTEGDISSPTTQKEDEGNGGGNFRAESAIISIFVVLAIRGILF